MKLWKWLVGLFFLLLLVDGALRKWVFPSQAALLFVLKDVVLWGGFGAYALWRSPTELPRPLRRTWLPLLLGAYVFVVLLQAFNLRQPAFIVSAIGLKAHLAYLPLVVLLPAWIAETSERRMMRLLWRYALCVFLPIVGLGLYQFTQPPTAWINQYVREMQAVATITKGVPRITGTFSYIGSFTAYLAANASLSGGVLFAGLRWRRRSLILLGSTLLIASLVILPMTGSRGPVLIVAGGFIILLLIARFEGRARLRFLGVAALLTVMVVQGVVVGGIAEQGWEALAQRTERAGEGEAQDRIVGLMLGPISGLERAGLFGYGVGTSHQAAPRFVSGSVGHAWLPDGYVENGIVRIITELGVLGWLVLVSLKLFLLYLAYQTVRRSRSPLELIVGSTAFCYLLPRLAFPVVFNVVSNAFYWGSAGAMLGVWSIQQLRRESSASRVQATPAEGVA